MERLAVDRDGIRLETYLARCHVLRLETQHLHSLYGNPFVVLERETELHGLREEGLQTYAVTEDRGHIVAEFGGGDVELFPFLVMQILAVEPDGQRLALSLLTDPKQREPGCPAPCGYHARIGGDVGMPLNVALSHHRHADRVGIVQGKIVDQPDAERKKERHQKH